MKSCTAILAFVLCMCAQSEAQIVPQPIMSFEKLAWGDSLGYVKRQLADKPSDGVPETSNSEHIRTYSFRDTINSHQIGVSLMFADDGRRLSAAAIFYFGRTASSEPSDSIRSRRVDDMWDFLVSHFGPLHTNKRTNAFGETITWHFGRTTVLMTKTRQGGSLLSLMYNGPLGVK